jgi:hypothetical protein
LAAGDRVSFEDGYRSMIFSLTPFFQEVSVFSGRLVELEGVVDKHIVVEATTDHRGNPHDPFFPQRLQYRDDVEYALVELQEDTPWGREKEQRTLLDNGMIGDDDVVLLSDADEIPSAKALKVAVENASEIPEVLRLAMHVYRPYWRWKDLGDHYQICRVFKGSLLRKFDLQQIRDMAGTNVMCSGEFPGHGWHMAYMGGPDMIRRKLASFAHDELSYATEKEIKDAYGAGKDLFGREIPIELVPEEDMPKVWR